MHGSVFAILCIVTFKCDRSCSLLDDFDNLIHELFKRFIKERKQKDPEVDVVVATKFAALPWRLGRQSVISALKASLSRLGLSSVELYQLHWYRIFFIVL